MADARAVRHARRDSRRPHRGRWLGASDRRGRRLPATPSSRADFCSSTTRRRCRRDGPGAPVRRQQHPRSPAPWQPPGSAGSMLDLPPNHPRRGSGSAWSWLCAPGGSADCCGRPSSAVPLPVTEEQADEVEDLHVQALAGAVVARAAAAGNPRHPGLRSRSRCVCSRAPRPHTSTTRTRRCALSVTSTCSSPPTASTTPSRALGPVRSPADLPPAATGLRPSLQQGGQLQDCRWRSRSTCTAPSRWGPSESASALGRLWERSDTFELGGRTIHALGAEERLLHACYHAALGETTPRLTPMRDLLQLALPPRPRPSSAARADPREPR